MSVVQSLRANRVVARAGAAGGCGALCCLLAALASCSGGSSGDGASVPPPTLEPSRWHVERVELAETSPRLTLVTANAMDIQPGVGSLAGGDFNGDGTEDLLVGLPFADGPENARPDAGEAVVIFGGGGLPEEIDLAADEPGLRVLGALQGDNLGFGVAAGDLNDDGVDDVIVSATGSNGLDNIRTDLGEAYVIFGRSGLGGVVDTLEEEQDFTFIAAEGFSRLGTSFAVADVNDDGMDDLIAGAPFAGREAGTPPGSPRTTVGEVYVVFGSRDLGGSLSVARDEQSLQISGLRQLDSFGESVAAADVNRDGVADMIVGAGGFDGPEGDVEGAGAVFVYFGSAELSGRLSLDDAAVTILGESAEDALGQAVAGGDFDGDGVADLAAVARSADGPDDLRERAGEAYVLRGGSLGGTIDLAVDEAYAHVYGAETRAQTATDLATGDLDGDGRDDLALGTPLGPRTELALSGVTYVPFGNVLTGVIDLADGVNNGLVVRGPAEDAAAGTGVLIADVLGAGRPQLILAAAGGAERGRVYVIEVPLEGFAG